MIRKLYTILILSLLGLFCLSATISAASKKQETKKNRISINKQKFESFAGGEREQQQGSETEQTKTYSAPTKSSSSISPGVAIGNTWQDYQHNGTIGRMIDWGNDSTASGHAIVHFGWTNNPGPVNVSRHYAYNYFDASLGFLGTQYAIQPPDEYAGYVNLQAKGNGEAIIGGHNSQGSGYQAHLYIPFNGFDISGDTRVPDSTASYHGDGPSQSVIWPKFKFQIGSDTVIHVIAQLSNPNAGGGGESIYYFRRIGSFELTSTWGGGSSQGTWDYPPYIIDTIHDLSHDIAASKTSDKVALVWTANLNYDPDTREQYPPGICDTCSGTSPYLIQWDNDIYYQISNDQGQTWEPRVNVTKYRVGEAGFRAYTDLSCLIDNTDDLHILWSAVPWAADINDVSIDNSCRLFHYSESVPFIRTVATAEWAASETDCGPGAWNLNISKMQISECDGKFYALWVQFNDVPNGVTDDCAAWSSSRYSGSANGELYLSVSSDGGSNWDLPRNLTNSRTPNCDPESGYDCESDNYPSMARFGRQNIAGEDWSSAEVVDPSSSYASDYYLDVQYVNDRDAGGIVQEEGTWQLSNINWFRLACVEPLPNPQIAFTPNNIDLPTWVKPTEFIDIDLTIENNGNVALTYSTIVEEDNGTPGWLATTGLSGSVPSGLSNIEVGTLHLNNGGVQSTEIGLVGRVIFISNALSSPDTLQVNLVVVDTLVPTLIDTVNGYLSLVVASNGNYGNSGSGRVNMDYVNNGLECDTTADVYLHDASPIIMTANDGDTTMASSIYGNGWLSPNGFKPMADGLTEPFSDSNEDYDRYYSGTFVTPDSAIALEQSFYAPKAPGSNFIIKRLKIWSHDGLAHNGLKIGDAVDWNIPSDSGAWNSTGMDHFNNLIYQDGAEYDNDDTLENGTIDPQGDDCIDAHNRFGGMAFVASYLNGVEYRTYPYSAYIASNNTFVSPQGNFLPGELWNNMEEPGLTVESSIEDLHMVFCYEPSFNLGANDTLVIWTTLVTVYNGTKADVTAAVIAGAEAVIFVDPVSCCIGYRGNVDGGPDDGSLMSVDISDLIYLICYMFQDCPFDCIEEADINGSGGDPAVDISDLIALVAYMFQGGPPPALCN